MNPLKEDTAKSKNMNYQIASHNKIFFARTKKTNKKSQLQTRLKNTENKKYKSSRANRLV